MNPSKTMQELVCSLMPHATNGKMEDQHGNDIKVANIKPHELATNKMVCKAVSSCAALSDQISDLRSTLETMFEQHVVDLFEQYDKKLGGKKGNVILYSFDRKLKLERSKQDRETTNEHIIVAKKLVDDCIRDWSHGANKNLQKFVEKYFRTDADGNYNVQDLKRLKAIDLEHPDENWDKAMEALDNSIVFDTTATYFRASYRDDTGNYIQIPLDIAKINSVRPQQAVKAEADEDKADAA